MTPATPNRLFKLLLRAYPRAFRERFGTDMTEAFRRGRREVPRGRGSWLRFWTGILVDFGTTLPRAWWYFRRPHPSPRRVRAPRSKEAPVVEHVIKDVRYAVRGLARQPGLALTAIVAIGLGIGLTTAMFSIVNGVILRGLPVEEPQEIMAINRVNPMEGPNRLAGRFHDYVDLTERQTTFEDLAAMAIEPMNVSPPDATPEFLFGARVTANSFSLLGTAPVLGRGFESGDETLGGPAVAVIGHRFWREHFDADPAIVGRAVRINGVPTTVVGVMPPDFEFPANQELWLPLRADVLALPRGEGPLVLMFGRLRDGVSMMQAQGDLERIMTQLGDEYPQTNQGMSVVVGAYVRELIGYQTTPLLFTMLGAVSLVLVIACANVANLLLARASLRGKEVAVRTALGASRRRVIGQLLIESSVIALAGAVVGIGLAQVGIALFNVALQRLPQGLPFWFAIEIDPSVLLFVLALTVTASLLSGILPALRASRADVNGILKDDSRGASSLRLGRLSRGLVVMEVAFSCALLVGAGLMIKSVTRLSNVDYAFASDDVFTALVTLPEAGYADAESRVRFVRDAVDRLAAQPSVRSAAATTDLPVVGFGNGRFALEGETYEGDRDYPSARIGSFTPEFLATLDIGLVEGRGFTALDNGDALPVAIVNRAFATKYFPNGGVLGQRVALQGTQQAGVANLTEDTHYTIVGVAPDLYLNSDLFVLAPEAIYFPFAQRPAGALSLVARVQGDPLAVTASVREMIASIDADLPISQVTTLGQSIADSQWFFTIFGAMFTVFGGVALFLATVGLYGVLSFTVNQRTHEVGLRVALGATPRQVVRLIMRQGMGQLAVGMTIGVVLAIGFGRMIAVLLYEVTASDPAVFGGIVVILVLTGLLASFLPARRATRVDPVVAMRG